MGTEDTMISDGLSCVYGRPYEDLEPTAEDLKSPWNKIAGHESHQKAIKAIVANSCRNHFRTGAGRKGEPIAIEHVKPQKDICR
jgi:hypothetical protein